MLISLQDAFASETEQSCITAALRASGPSLESLELPLGVFGLISTDLQLLRLKRLSILCDESKSTDSNLTPYIPTLELVSLIVPHVEVEHRGSDSPGFRSLLSFLASNSRAKVEAEIGVGRNTDATNQLIDAFNGSLTALKLTNQQLSVMPLDIRLPSGLVRLSLREWRLSSPAELFGGADTSRLECVRLSSCRVAGGSVEVFAKALREAVPSLREVEIHGGDD